MWRLHYAGDTVLVGGGVGNALLLYARALADSQIADVVAIPVSDDAGHVSMASFLLGPASQLFVTPAEVGVANVGDDQVVVADLERRTRLLQPSAGITRPTASSLPFDHDGSNWPERG